LIIQLSFLRKVKKLQQNDQKKLSEKIGWFAKNASDPRLKVHALGGKLDGYFAFSLDYGRRVVGVKTGADAVMFIDVGSHDEVYR
jgi:mRNA-degrading endonuclease YafQ of YafQ-DinJ toxin-antitoxin module